MPTDPTGPTDPKRGTSAAVLESGSEVPPDDTEQPAIEPALIDANLADSFGEYANAWIKRARSGDAGLLPVLAGFVVIIIIFQTQNAHFLTSKNFVALLGQASYFVLFGMAEVFVLLLGEIDLSTGFVGVCGGALTAILASDQLHGWPWWGAALAGLAFCGLVGVVQGLLVTILKVPSFVVTLGGQLAFGGMLLFILNSWSGASSGGTVAVTNSILVDLNNGAVTPIAGWIIMIVLVALFAAYSLGRDQRRRASGLVAPPLALTLIKIGGVAVAGVVVVAVCNINTGIKGGRVIEGVPWDVFIILGVLVAATFLLARTRFGRYVYAVGGNAEAARRAGISLLRIRLLCFTLCSLMSGLAGLFYVSNLQSISTSVPGGNLVLYAIAAAVIGGTSLFGGRGRFIHAVIGGLIIATIANGMGLIGLNADAQDIVTALVLVAAATVDALGRRGRVAA
jgi:D-xylose transport system permease protein